MSLGPANPRTYTPWRRQQGGAPWRPLLSSGAPRSLPAWVRLVAVPQRPGRVPLPLPDDPNSHRHPGPSRLSWTARRWALNPPQAFLGLRLTPELKDRTGYK